MSPSPRGLGQVGRGDVKVRDVMSWDGNYSDCAFGSHRPSQLSLNQEDMSGSTSLLGSNLSGCKHRTRPRRKHEIIQNGKDRFSVFKKAPSSFFFIQSEVCLVSDHTEE